MNTPISPCRLGSMYVCGEWLKRLGVPLRPGMDELYASATAGHCMLCDRTLPVRKQRRGRRRRVCPADDCREGYYAAHAADRWYRALLVRTLCVGAVALALSLKPYTEELSHA